MLPVEKLAGPVRDLETLLARIRQRNATLLDIDMWDRWGRQHASDQEIAEREVNLRWCTSDRTAAVAELEALVARLRVELPEAIAAWVDAHDRFLAAFIADHTPPAGSSDETAVFVAKEERTAWAAVERGDQPFVDENCFYITIDRDRYRALFGVDP